MSAIIFAPDTLRTQVEAATGGHVTVLYDDKGYPSYMRRIPKFRYEDLGFDDTLGEGVATAFIVGGEEKSEILIGQYPARVYDGRACSLPGKDPTTSISFDDSRAACADKGPGWHLMTRHEWAAIALWCMANGFEPHGNTDWGRYHDAHFETAMRPDGYAPGDDDNGNGRTVTGGGPASWRHNGEMTGIADLVGNVWEWVDGMKLVDGRIICTTDNDFTADEGSWTETDSYFSTAGGTTHLTNTQDGGNGYQPGPAWADVHQEDGYTAEQILKRLLVVPAGIEPQGRLYVNDEGERFPGCGGTRNHRSYAGLAALNWDNTRSDAGPNRGFRPAFVS